ncbi:MAG: ATP-binding protein, partial [Dehalococcoidia bacterium]
MDTPQPRRFWEEPPEPAQSRRRPAYKADAAAESAVMPLPESVMERLEEDIDVAGGPFEESPVYAGCNGRTMFDSAGSEDNTVTVLLPDDQIGSMPAQSLVRIKSRPDGDGHVYLGVVVKGPFAEPDGLRADAPVVVTTTVRGGIFMPRYHGRVQVELMGEDLGNGAVEPPRFRPLPNSPVFVLGAEETALVMRTQGDVRLGLAVGQNSLPVAIPLTKSVLPRHTGILGTTGGGKSTTVSGMIGQLQRTGVATILIDTEGEYTEIDHPAEDQRMLARLSELGREPEGVANTSIYHLIGRDTANPDHHSLHPFSLRLSKISPYSLAGILDLPEAQEERFFKAYDLAKIALERLGIYPRRGSQYDQQQAQDTDEFERGWPGMNLQHLYDIVALGALHTDKRADEWAPSTQEFATEQAKDDLKKLIAGSHLPSSVPSWRALQGKLGRLRRLGIFDQPRGGLNFERLIQPGQVSIVDLSDTDSPQVNNLVIAELLRGVMDHQDEAYARATKQGTSVTPVVIFIEEAHEFLSAERIRRMEALFQQVARIARRGRKRWLGLVFITQ